MCYNIWCSSPVCLWVSSLARSCATRDANNKDNVHKPNIPVGIKCPPPSKTISPITWFGAISTRLARIQEGLQSSSQGPCETVFFYIGWKTKRTKAEYFGNTFEGRRVTTGRRAGVTGPGAGATRRERDIRTGAEDAEYRSGSDAKKGERLLLERE